MEKVQLYIKSSCASSRKALKYLVENDIEHDVIAIQHEGVTRELVKKVLFHSENGVEDVVVGTLTKNNRFKGITVEGFIDIILENPKFLKTPIVVQGNKLQVGYNVEDMGTFLPRHKKQLSFMKNLLQTY